MPHPTPSTPPGGDENQGKLRLFPYSHFFLTAEARKKEENTEQTFKIPKNLGEDFKNHFLPSAFIPSICG
jgi:hypothetical protein